jgi:putative DNA primase/helicase
MKNDKRKAARSSRAQSTKQATAVPWKLHVQNDTGNAERLLKLHGKDMLWVRVLNAWVCWDGTRWVIDNTGIAERFAMNVVTRMRSEAEAMREHDEQKADRLLGWATRCGEAHKLAAMLRVARAFKGMTVTLDQFDSHPELLAFADKTVELSSNGTLTAREHRREDFITRMIPTDYAPKAKAPTWEALLKDKLPDAEVRRFFQKLMGVTVYGGNPEQMLVFAKGATNTSKSTVLEIVAEALGRDYAGTFNPSLFREKRNEAPRPDIINTILRRFLYVSELSSEWELHADVIKRMTGEDTLTARKGHGNDFLDRRPDWTAWIATNHSPTINGADKALWRRLYVIPFDVQHTRVRKGVRQRIITDEAPGVLTWVLKGWRLYCREGLNEVPAAVAESTMVLRESLSTFDRWLTACCETAAEYADTNTNLWESYRAWCSDEDVKTGGGAAFKQQMEGRFRVVRRRPKGGTDNKIRLWAGVRVRPVSVKSASRA